MSDRHRHRSFFDDDDDSSTAPSSVAPSQQPSFRRPPVAGVASTRASSSTAALRGARSPPPLSRESSQIPERPREAETSGPGIGAPELTAENVRHHNTALQQSLKQESQKPYFPPPNRPPQMSRSAMQSRGRKRARSRWALLMWLPYLMLFLHRQDEIEAETNNVISVYSVTVASLVTMGVLTLNESSDGPHLIVVSISVFLSFAYGAVFHVLQDLIAARFFAMVWIGCCAGQLRFHWDVRRLSRRVAYHPLWRRLWNWYLRKGGLLIAVFAGETLGCILCVPDGWTLIPASLLGYALVLILPYATFKLASLVSQFLMTIFHKVSAQHIANRSTLQVIYWFTTVVVSCATLFLAVAYFLVSYVPIVWQQQLLMAPYGWVLELCSFNSRKQRITVGGYDKVREEYGDLVQDVMKRKKEYRCH